MRKKQLKGYGENHTFLYTGKGILGLEKASFMGPGTNLTKRLKMNSQPKTYSDKVSQAHDIRYGLSENIVDIRKADNKMLQSLEKASKEKLDYEFNIKQGQVGIKSKIFLEDYMKINPKTFASFGKNDLSKEEIDLYTNKLNELEMEGFGYKRKIIKKCKF